MQRYNTGGGRDVVKRSEIEQYTADLVTENVQHRAGYLQVVLVPSRITSDGGDCWEKNEEEK